MVDISDEFLFKRSVNQDYRKVFNSVRNNQSAMLLFFLTAGFSFTLRLIASAEKNITYAQFLQMS